MVVLAQEEARSLSHNYIGTEHILLGLIREGEGVGVVQKLRTDEERAREQLALEIAEAAAARDRAIADEDFETATKRRDLERTLRERARARALPAPDLMGEIRRRLGIPGPPQDPESLRTS